MRVENRIKTEISDAESKGFTRKPKVQIANPQSPATREQ
jgi:hypothetical protein